MSQLNFGLFRRGQRRPGHVPQSPARRRLREALIEALENRTMLSVSAQSLAGVSLVPGNVRTYDVNGNSLTYTTVGTELFNGNTATRVDVSFSVPVRTYIGTAVNGDFVDFGQVIEQTSTRTQTTTNSPYEVELPANMTAGVNYTFNHTDTRTTVDGGSTDTDVEQVSKVITLESETPSALIVPAGTFNAYKITQVVTTTETGGFTEVETLQLWYAVGIGLVKSITDNVTTALTSFTSADAQLVFSFQPSTVEADTNFDPPVTVSVFEGGVLDTDATGTITLSKKNFPRSGTGTLGGTLTRPVVGGVAVFDDLKISKDGGYILTASSSVSTIADVDSNKFRVGAGDLSFEINTRTTAKSKKGVVSGDTILYSVLVNPEFVVQSQTITLSLPPGLIPNNLTGGATFSGNTITCTVSSAQAINFDIIVPDAKTLSEALNGETKIIVAGDAEVIYTDGSEDAGTATSSVEVAIDRTIKGKLADALFDYPRRTDVPTSRGLAGAEVALVDETGAVVATLRTGKSGAYSFVAPAGGTYTVRVSAAHDAYDSALDAVTIRRMYGGKQVRLEQANMIPIDVGTTVLPVSFMSSSAATLLAMNHYTTTGFQGLSAFKIDLFRFNTKTVEAVLTERAGTEANPTAMLDPAAIESSSAVDPWVAAIRMMAGIAEVHERFTDTFRLTDQAGKSLAIAVGAEIAKRTAIGTGKALKAQAAKLPKPSEETLRKITAEGIEKKLNASARIAGFTALGPLLSTGLDIIGVQAESKAKIMAVTFILLRYGSEAATGNLIPDLAFETVFNIVRVTFDAALLGNLGGVEVRYDDLPFAYFQLLSRVVPSAETTVASGSAQAIVNDLVTRRMQYDPATGTSAMLRSLGDFNKFFRDRANSGIARTAVVNSVNSLIRGGAGILEIQTVIDKIQPGTIASNSAFQKSMNSVLTRFEKSFTKYTGGGLKAVQTRVQIAVFVSATDSLIQQLFAITKIPDIVAVGHWTPPITPSSVPAAMPAGVRPLATAIKTPTGSAAPLTTLPLALDAGSTAAYLDDLSLLAGLVTRKDTAAIDAMYTPFAASEAALLEDLAGLVTSATLGSLQLGTSEGSLIGQFGGAVERAVNSTLLAQAQLGTWIVDPATGDAKAVIAQLKRAAAAVKSAIALANRVQPLIGGLVAPPTLVFDYTDVPQELAIGATASVTFTVTNIGGSPTSAGSIELATASGTLAIQGPAAQSLPALAAGGSAAVTWQVTAVAPPTAESGSVFQVVATAADLRAAVTGEIAVA